MTAQAASTGGQRLAASIRARAATGKPALVPYVTGGFPTRDALPGLLKSIAPHAAAIEIGVPFTDPMADGVTIQHASRVALEGGASLSWILSCLGGMRTSDLPPLVLMGYLNPFIAFRLEKLADAAASAGVCALIVPDLPAEECEPLRRALHKTGVGLVQLASPVTPPERLAMLGALTDGFLYAVTTTGVTGSTAERSAPRTGAISENLISYLSRCRAASSAPVCAGFGIKSAAQVAALTGHADGVIVGSALISAIERGDDAGAFVAGLAGA